MDKLEDGLMKTIHKIYCSGCGKYFAGTAAFDDHRTGSFKVNQRHCLSTQEMEHAGFACERLLVRLFRNGVLFTEEHDVWFLVADRERARQKFGNMTRGESAGSL